MKIVDVARSGNAFPSAASFYEANLERIAFHANINL